MLHMHNNIEKPELGIGPGCQTAYNRVHVHVFYVCIISINVIMCDVCARRVIAVVFQKRIVVLDAGSFENKFVIRSK